MKLVHNRAENFSVGFSLGCAKSLSLYNPKLDSSHWSKCEKFVGKFVVLFESLPIFMLVSQEIDF